MGHIGLEITVKERLDEGTSENAEYRYVATRPSARIYDSASHEWERRSGGSCAIARDDHAISIIQYGVELGVELGVDCGVHSGDAIRLIHSFANCCPRA